MYEKKCLRGKHFGFTGKADGEYYWMKDAGKIKKLNFSS